MYHGGKAWSFVHMYFIRTIDDRLATYSSGLWISWRMLVAICDDGNRMAQHTDVGCYGCSVLQHASAQVRGRISI